MNLEPYLSRWLKAGILDEAAGERVRSFESARAADGERPGLLEVIIYLAVAVIGVGVSVLVSSRWQHIPRDARISMAGSAAATAFVAGVVLRRSTSSGLRRGSQATWLLCEALAGATAAITVNELGARAEWVALVAALVTLPVAMTLWAFSRTHLQVAGLAGASWLAAVAATGMVAEHANRDFAPLTLGLTLITLSLSGIVAVEREVLVPASSARLLTCVSVAVAVIFTGIDPAPPAAEALAFIVAGVLVFLSLRRAVFAYMAVATTVVFIGLIIVILRHVGDPTVAALALIGIGLLILAGIVGLERWRPWTLGQKPGPRPPHLSAPV